MTTGGKRTNTDNALFCLMSRMLDVVEYKRAVATGIASVTKAQ